MSLLLTSFNDYVYYLQQKFAETTNWSDQQTSALTTLLSDAFADVAQTNNSTITFSAREAFIRLARRESSVLENARFLGVPITRKGAASTTALMTNAGSDPVSVGLYDAFTVNGLSAYTRNAYVINSMESVAVDLFMGSAHTQTFGLSQVTDYFSIVLGESGFGIGDIQVWTQDSAGNRVMYYEHEAAIFLADQGSNLYITNTLPDGDVMITFGSTLFGRQPDSDHTLYIRYFKSDGALDNTDKTELSVDYQSSTYLRGRTKSGITGGSNQKDLNYYRVCAPILGSAKRKLIRLDEWEAALRLSGGVADCAVLGQREIAPNDPAWQGVVRVCVLPESTLTLGGINPNPSSAAWTKLIDWLSGFKSPLVIQTWNPDRILVDAEIEVKVTDDVDITTMYPILQEAVRALFKRRAGVLGRRAARDDMATAIKFVGDVRRQGIDYVTVINPTTDIVPSSRMQWVDLRNLKLSISYTERK